MRLYVLFLAAALSVSACHERPRDASMAEDLDWSSGPNRTPAKSSIRACSAGLTGALFEQGLNVREHYSSGSVDRTRRWCSE
ncbi:MAG: hypothetical protein ACI9MC_000656 [Kiritimatiellia bacterium]|jgi:hypothetical protein